MSCFTCCSSQKSKTLERIDSKERPQPSVSPLLPSRQSYLDKKESELAETSNKENGQNIQQFTFQELSEATMTFNAECLVNIGSFGKIYRGKLRVTEEIIHVERLDRSGLRGHREFLTHLLMLSLLNHPNLIRLIGYCNEGDERLLVHEYLPLGSLDQHLHDRSSKQKPLDWYTRMKIALGIAQGLEYLHHKANPPVIYRNLKPSNILLDDDYNAKLSDLGLSKLGPLDGKQHVHNRVIGTFGYIAPEYGKTGILSVKADVYSFGVVLLELITGRRALDITRQEEEEEQNLISWIHEILKDQKKCGEIADPVLEGNFPAKGFIQALIVVAMCLQEENTARPMMSDVVNAIMYLTSTHYE